MTLLDVYLYKYLFLTKVDIDIELVLIVACRTVEVKSIIRVITFIKKNGTPVLETGLIWSLRNSMNIDRYTVAIEVNGETVSYLYIEV